VKDHTKSYVGMLVSVCPICGKLHDEEILLHKRFAEVLPRYTLRDYELCPEHAAMQIEYIALVETSNKPGDGSMLKPSDAKPTGHYAHVRRTAASRLFNVPPDPALPFIYVEQGVLAALRAMAGAPPEEPPPATH
jgi:hypothetical protein